MAHKIVIVGAGPSGISAANELARQGLPCTVLDESPKIGGVIYRGAWRQTANMPHLDEKLKASMAKLHREYETYSSAIKLNTNTRILGPSTKNNLLLIQDEKLSNIEYQHLVLATGCQERSIPFPGWQLPGVMLLGGIQLQLKSGLVRPGHKVAIVGTGPLLILVACQLHKAGCDLVGIYEAASFNSFAHETLAMLNRPQLVLDGLSMMLYLKKHHISLNYGWGIVNAEGENQLSQVTIAPYDQDWNADLSQSRTLTVDTLGVGYGFVARSQLMQLMALDMEYDHMNGVIPKVDSWQRSSVSNIYCVGDSARLAGADAAIIEGIIAAKAIAVAVGYADPVTINKEMQALRKTLCRFYRFRQGFDNAGYRKTGLVALPDENTIICRCERVKKKDIDKAISQGCKDIITLKMRTRVTMGDCQGKTCSHYCYDRIAIETRSNVLSLIRPRFPLDPIPFAAMEAE